MSEKPQDGVSGTSVAGSWDVPTPTQKSLFSLRYHKLVAKRINALLKMIAVSSKSNGPLIMSDGNAVLPVAGTPQSGGGTPGSGTTLAEFKFVTMNADDMDCHTWDGTTEGTSVVKVMKPSLLKWSQPSPRVVQGVSIAYSSYSTGNQSRVATNTGGSITQVITPQYVSGDVIIAAKITLAGSPTWVDVNNDGRTFAGPST